MSSVKIAYGKQKKFLEREITSWKTLIVASIGLEQYNLLFKTVESYLSPILRSSSVVENTNSRLRRFFNSSRGEINQARLNLIRFYLNHKVFKRGPRKGKSPAQLYYQDNEISSQWLEVLRQKMALQAAA